MASESQDMTLAELAAKADVPGRTVRFYIARGLLPGPGKAGRGASYGTGHLQRLRQIAALQAKGLTLTQIASQLEGGTDKAMGLAPVGWWHYQVADDVSVSVRADASPWRFKQVRTCIAQIAASLCAKKAGNDYE